MGLRPIDGALLAGAALCVAGALILSSTPLPAENAVGYTQLWALPADASAAPGVRVGVDSAETEPLAYRLEVRRPGGGPPVSSRLRLEPGQESVRFVGVESPPPGGVRVTALLYREDRPGVVYRRVTEWVQGA